MELIRTELKFLIRYDEYVHLRNQIRLLMSLDPHANDQISSYAISSLYFDDMYDSHVLEKADGIECHQKFRIRQYGIESKRLEYKTKIGNMTSKQSLWLTDELADALIKRDYPVLYQSIQEPLISHIITKMKLDDLKPVLFVDYLREAYTYKEGDVRVTFDTDIETTIFDRMVKMKRKVLEPAQIMLEVKYTEILPEFIRKIIFFRNFQMVSYSKYYMSWLLTQI